MILVLTNHQGYGDMSCHGNPCLKTPELDRLHNKLELASGEQRIATSFSLSDGKEVAAYSTSVEPWKKQK